MCTLGAGVHLQSFYYFRKIPRVILLSFVELSCSALSSSLGKCILLIIHSLTFDSALFSG